MRQIISKTFCISASKIGFKNCVFKVFGGRKPVCSIWLFLILNLREVFANAGILVPNSMIRIKP